MRRIDIQPRVPLVKEDGTPSQETALALQEIARMLRDLEARVAALETP